MVMLQVILLQQLLKTIGGRLEASQLPQPPQSRRLQSFVTCMCRSWSTMWCLDRACPLHSSPVARCCRPLCLARASQSVPALSYCSRSVARDSGTYASCTFEYLVSVLLLGHMIYLEDL